jgi:hypothetical protein
MSALPKPYYEEKNITLYCGDCRDIIPDLPKVDLVLTDPPYGIGMDNSNKRTKPSRPNSYTQYPDFRYHETDWDEKPITKELFDLVIASGNHQIIFGANYYPEYLFSSMGWIAWDKKLDNSDFSDFELAFTSFERSAKIFS